MSSTVGTIAAGSLPHLRDTDDVLPPPARLLRLLSLLQSRRDWPGPELAGRLEVSARTLRTDIGRLRELGYPVAATPGPAGGYRLGVGAALPPLLLDDEEAVAIAVGLRSAAGGAVVGIEETSVRALTKLEHVLPSRLRQRVGALAAAVVPAPGRGPTVPADVLIAVSTAVRDQQRLRFDYADHHGRRARRETEPHRLVHTGRRWYLVAWDVRRGDWRTFRVDRMEPVVPTGPRFAPRDPPAEDLAGYVSSGVGAALWQHQATVRLHAPYARIAPQVTPVMGTVEPDGDGHCLFRTGADTLPVLARYLALLGVDFDVVEPPELREHVRAVGERFLRAAGG
jgi:predicted DNA-binding transcriptional regulator YafY